MKREYNHHQSPTEDDASVASDADVSLTSNTSAARASWCGTQVHSELCLNGNSKLETRKGKEDDTMVLDSGSSISLFKSKDLVSSMREAPVKIELDTNAGSKIVDRVGDVEGVGIVYFNQNSIVYIFCTQRSNQVPSSQVRFKYR